MNMIGEHEVVFVLYIGFISFVVGTMLWKCLRWIGRIRRVEERHDAEDDIEMMHIPLPLYEKELPKGHVGMLVGELPPAFTVH